MSIKYLQLPVCKLSGFLGSAVTSFDVSGFLLNDGTTPVDPADIGDVCYATLEPKTVREELVSFTIDSVTAEGVATLTVTRGLLQKSPYGVGGASFDHQSGSDFVISNNPGLLNHFAAKDNEETITEQWTFPDPTVAGAPVTKDYYETDQTAVDLTVVHKTGDETIAGEKTFTTSPKIPDSTASDEALTKGESDTIEAENVKLTGNQTIAGEKTFTTSPKIPDAVAADEPYTKGQHDADAVAAGSTASPTVRGTTKIDTAADSPTDPVALTATADRVAALAGGGNFGVPGAVNRFITEEGLPSEIGKAEKIMIGTQESFDASVIQVPVSLSSDGLLLRSSASGVLGEDLGFHGFVKDNTQNETAVNSGGSSGVGTHTLTAPAGNNRVILVFTYHLALSGTLSLPSAIEWNGMSFTKIVTENTSPIAQATVWELAIGDSLTDETFDVVVTGGSGDSAYSASSLVYENVDQSAITKDEGSGYASGLSVATPVLTSPQGESLFIYGGITGASTLTLVEAGTVIRESPSSRIKTGDLRVEGDQSLEVSGNVSTSIVSVGVVLNSSAYEVELKYGPKIEGFTGLIPGSKYYVQDARGTIGLSAGTTNIPVGVAVNETTLLSNEIYP